MQLGHPHDSRSFAVALVGVMLWSPSVRADGGQWKVLAPMRLARDHASAARIGDAVYVLGGHVDPAHAVSTHSMEVYDILTDSWSAAPSAPTSATSGGMAALGKKLYAVYDRDLYIYDTEGRYWTTGASRPTKTLWPSVVAHRSRIYVVGGVDVATGPVRTVWCYDPGTDGWSTVAPMLTPRVWLAVASCGAFLYALAGYDEWSTGTRECERYDPVLDSWEPVPAAPYLVAEPSATALAGRIHLIDGPKHLTFDVLSARWTVMPRVPFPRENVPVVALDDRLLVPSGLTSSAPRPTNHVDSFVPDVDGGASPYCFCDSAAPCGNEHPFGGCVNSTGVGALLTGAGSARIASDDLVLLAERMPLNQNGIFWIGDGQIDVPFGDGHLCVGSGGIGNFHFPVQSSRHRGAFVLGPGIVAQSSSAITIAPGSTWNFQAGYRDPLGPCGLGFNTTNALAVTWAP